MSALTAAGWAFASPAWATPDDILNRYYDLKRSDGAAATTYLADMVGQHGDDVRIRLELGYDLLAQDRADEALAQFEAAVSIDPAHVQTWKQIGYVRINLGRDADALAAFERV
ncbi:MAG: hypothetical protein WCY11_11910, partial [Novosphingobium sp.]